jgi:hypothetical protein
MAIAGLVGSCGCGAVFARRRQASSSPGSGGIFFLQWSGWSRWQPAGHQRSLTCSRWGKGEWALRTLMRGRQRRVSLLS